MQRNEILSSIHHHMRNITVPGRRRVRRFVKDVKAQPYHVANTAMLTLSIAGNLIAGGNAAVDAISHADKTFWLAIPLGDCVGTVLFHAHTVTPDERVTNSMQPFEGDPKEAASLRESIHMDLSGKPIEVNGRVICFSGGAHESRGIIFQNSNSNALGTAEGQEDIFSLTP